jgi:hypothetical protein
MFIPYLSIVARDIDEAIFGVDVEMRPIEAVIDALLEWSDRLSAQMPSGSSIVHTAALVLRRAMNARDHTSTVQFADAANLLIEMYQSMTEEEREAV